jgi:FKBP-type peptidyl-prolyl cis-trans isomerase
MKRKGVKITDLVLGEGRLVEKPLVARIIYDLTLSRGDVVQSRVDCIVELGLRRVIAGLRYGIEGMREGGRRKIVVSPHLAYGEIGLCDRIPPNAVLIFHVELLEVLDEYPTG